MMISGVTELVSESVAEREKKEEVNKTTTSSSTTKEIWSFRVHLERGNQEDLGGNWRSLIDVVEQQSAGHVRDASQTIRAN
ncbi:hypothetical protein CpipJ_CPIJ009410 [Culex quinquefasciatus]|uniref:Uncharacterized protein n=1 Tax=Culex quinquefasciatus TaxID=7176 RepID=B0WQM0_CULQU|nr:hypothetical protein CpipJ_CPIJ009410 [Culex quinquefasciatus]|eukprot:XP_001851004.1 hypothetical protein CpipJ_CPIJ009410 [Culex quinquefasciatus]